VLHGGLDECTGEQGVELYAALRRAGVETGLVIDLDERHSPAQAENRRGPR
jgi:dipeptidyl aminopeptidase/acylaminoacyl peptidase